MRPSTRPGQSGSAAITRENVTATLPPSRTTADEAGAQAGRDSIQGFAPLIDSLRWRSGQASLRQRGNQTSLSGAHPVPLGSNNDALG